jgi:hypothetical protein
MIVAYHRRTSRGLQKGRRRPKAAVPAGGPPLKQLKDRFSGGLPERRRRVGHGRPK